MRAACRRKVVGTGGSIIAFYVDPKMDSTARSDGLLTYSPESLQAFVEAAALGPFPAAALCLRSTQTTFTTALPPL